MRVGLMTQESCFTLEPLVVKKVFHIVKQPVVLQKQSYLFIVEKSLVIQFVFFFIHIK